MTQPEYVPVSPADRVRLLEKLPPPRRWVPNRPGETMGGMPEGRLFGEPGPDQGYAFRLARGVEARLVLASGEHIDDVIAGGVAVAMRRASQFHRAPVIHDIDLAFTVWGFLGVAPDDLVTFRRQQFEGAAHDYEAQRMVAEAVTEEALRSTAESVRSKLSAWRELFVA